MQPITVTQTLLIAKNLGLTQITFGLRTHLYKSGAYLGQLCRIAVVVVHLQTTVSPFSELKQSLIDVNRESSG